MLGSGVTLRRLWRFLVGTWRGRLITAIVLAVPLALVGALVAGSGSSTVGASSYSASDRCTSASAEANVRVTVYSSEGRGACEAINRGVAREAGYYWRVQPEGAELEGELVCSMGKGGAIIEVRDTGGHYYGNHICAALTAKGWTEKEGPGRQVERERAQRESEAKAATARREQEEEAARQHTQAIEQHTREAREKVERSKEEATRKQEEATRNREEAGRRGQEAHEQSQHEHEEAQRQAHEAAERKKEEGERAAEQRKIEAETRHSQEEAEHSH